MSVEQSVTHVLGQYQGPPNISLDRTALAVCLARDAGRVWRDCCMLRMVRGQGGAWPRPISSRALSCLKVENSHVRAYEATADRYRPFGSHP